MQCGSEDGEATMLLCDVAGCPGAYHLSCLDPPL